MFPKYQNGTWHFDLNPALVFRTVTSVNSVNILRAKWSYQIKNPQLFYLSQFLTDQTLHSRLLWSKTLWNLPGFLHPFWSAKHQFNTESMSEYLPLKFITITPFFFEKFKIKFEYTTYCLLWQANTIKSKGKKRSGQIGRAISHWHASGKTVITLKTKHRKLTASKWADRFSISPIMSRALAVAGASEAPLPESLRESLLIREW